MNGRMSLIALFLVGALLSGGMAAFAQPAAPPKWDRETLSLFSLLPIQDGGRVKPLDTYAAFTLLQIHGRRGLTNLSGDKLTPMEWLLNTLFFPDTAKKYNLFRVENSEAIITLGLEPKRKRDYYSYEELLPARHQLIMLGRQYMEKDGRLRTSLEKEIVGLAINLRTFEALTTYTEFSRARFDVSTSARLSDLFPGRKECRLSDILRKGPQILAVYMELHHESGDEGSEFAAVTRILRAVEEAANNATALALFPPPPASDSREWSSPADLVGIAFSGEPIMMGQVSLLAGFEALAEAADTPDEFRQRAQEFSGATVQIAESRGEYNKIPLEVTYYRLKFFQRSLILYVISFLVVACMWMRPNNRILSWGAFTAVLLPTCLLLIGIVLRSIIRGRPPVTSVYETILFVTFVAAAVALFIEWANRQGLAISLGALLGAGGMFFANRYEAGYGSDTMPTMAAVLDTNFWLALHVTTIAIGYGAGFLASGLAHVFVFGRLIGYRRNSPVFYRDITRMVYGSLCFAFVFVALGTVLGGIWANESWGRFWGWDPKENGALMICLWQLAIMHARLDGLLRDHGINIAAIIGGIIIAFCWFGVNMLGVGLHSYGFSSGGYTALINFYLIQTGVVLLGCFIWFRERNMDTETL